MTDNQVPQTIEWTDEDLRNAGKRDQLSLGWYAFMVTDVKNSVSKNGHLMQRLTLKALRDPQDANSTFGPRVYHNVTLPFPNKGVAGHRPPNTTGICASTLRAAFGDIPDYPRKGDDGWTYNDEAISQNEVDDIRANVNKTVWEKLKGLWVDGSPWKDCMFYAKMVENGEYRNLKAIQPTLPDGEDLVDPENAIE